MDSPQKKSLYTRRVIDISLLNNILTESSSHGLCGSRNLGNTCFMNSSIACLQNCIDLTTYFLTKQYKEELNDKNDRGLHGELAEEWYNLLENYWVNSQRVGDPSSFKSTISSKAKIFRGYRQHDSNEFMTYFLDYINEDLNKVTNQPYVLIDEKKDDEEDIVCAKRYWDLHLSRNDSIITDLFSGQYKCTITCPECKWISTTFDPFNTLMLNIPGRDFLSKKKNIILYYVPKFCLRDTLKISTCINKDLKFSDLKNVFESENELKLKVNDMIFVNVSDKKFKKFCGADDEVCSYKNAIICYDKYEENKNVTFVYIMGEYEYSKSSYPRIIFIDNKTTFDDIKMNLYFMARKFIDDPFDNKEDDDEFRKLLEELNEDNNEINEDKIIEYLTKEYGKIFKNENLNEEEKKLLEKFNSDFPFNFLIINNDEDNEKEIELLNNEKLEEELKELSDKEDITSKILDLLLNKDFSLKIKFNINSKFAMYNLSRKFDHTSKVSGKSMTEEESSKSLYDCLEYFRTEEILEEGNEWYCKKCKKFQLAKKKMDLFYLPKILMICLKRFSNESRYSRYSSFSWGKDDSFIDFPINNMDLKEYIIGPDKDNVKYDLYAVSQHYGGTGGGHYTACCKNFDKWYSYNDSSCSLTSASDVVSSAAYVLFYRRQTD